jgi:hypothetical protein
VPFQHRELLAEYEVLKKEVLTVADKSVERPEPQQKEIEHGAEL